MSGYTIRRRRGNIDMRDRDIIYNGGIIDQCICGDNVRVRE